MATVLTALWAGPASAGAAPPPASGSPVVAAHLTTGATTARTGTTTVQTGATTEATVRTGATAQTGTYARTGAGDEVGTDERFVLRAAGRVGGTASDVDVLSVRGAGPYRIGVGLDRLTAAGLIDWSVATCDGVVRAGATGTWAGVVLLAFRHGRLVEVSTATVPPHSPAGAGVGMTFAELETIYGPRGELIHNDAGTATAYLVRVGSRVELFTGHPIRPGVGAFQVGPASFVERGFRQGCTC